MNKLRKLPIGIQDFEKLRINDFIYADKTKHIYDIIKLKSPCFLSRPRRFGKSLLISTMAYLFQAKKELFSGLWIEKSDWDWQEHPVIQLDMGIFGSRSTKLLEKEIKDELLSIAKRYKVETKKDSTATSLFKQLIEELSQINQVVVLIDEYDKPLLDQINHPDRVKDNREFLRQFYGILKAQDQYLKFIFLTGVTKFSKVSVFSGLNNLKDLTMNDQTSAIAGYTRSNLEEHFNGYMQAFCEKENMSMETLRQQIKHWYNGYQFSKEGTLVYNPFSILSFFGSDEFRSHWFETGTPTFLLKIVKQQSFDVINLEGIDVSSNAFDTYETEDMNLPALLYQTGYLTIKHYDPLLRSYTLDYPNFEIYHALTESLIKFFSPTHQGTSLHELTQLSRNLLYSGNEWDAQDFFEHIKTMLGYMPYDLFAKSEKHYHSLLFMIIKLAGANVQAEVHTRKGRADLVVITKEKIIIFEFKLNETAKAAIAQIHEKKYYENFKDRKLPIYLAGINFNGEKREIDDCAFEKLTD